MKNKLLALLALGLLAESMAANAVPISYDFTVNGGSDGPLAGATATGYFTFDDSIVPSGGGFIGQTGLLLDLEFTWNGIFYDENTANTGWMVFESSGALAGVVFGTDCSADSCSFLAPNGWVIDARTFVSGASGLDFFYNPGGGVSTTFRGSGPALSPRVSSVPEPGTLALLGLGLAGLGFASRKKSAAGSVK